MINKKIRKDTLLKKVMILIAAVYVNCTYAQTFVVTKITDPAPSLYNVNDTLCDTAMLGTLQWAVRKVNDASGSSIIAFNIPGSAPHVISLNYLLPVITKDTVTIAGTSQPDYDTAHNAPSVIIQSNVSEGLLSYGLSFSSVNQVIVTGLYLRKFSDQGIKLSGCEDVIIDKNFINQIYDISGDGILMDNSSNNILSGNIIGTDTSGSVLSVGHDGIAVTNNSDYNTIASNRIENCLYSGVHIYNNSDNNIVSADTINNNSIAGIYIEENSPFNILVHNVLIGNTAAIILDGGNQDKLKPTINPISNIASVTGTAQAGDLIEIFGSSAGDENANEYLTEVTADEYGNWIADLTSYIGSWQYITATATEAITDETTVYNTSPLSTSVIVVNPCDPVTIGWDIPGSLCAGNPIMFINNYPVCGTATYTWDFGDGTIVTGSNGTHIFTAPGTYTVTFKVTYFDGEFETVSTIGNTIDIIECPDISCEDCIGSFAPGAGDYILSAWVKEANGTSLTTYSNAGIKISFTGSALTYGPFLPDPSTVIIDGWQKIENKFTVPIGATQIHVELVNNWTTDVFFDDIRIHPFNSNMKSYVYDPVTLRLAAELDENNYATFYEYDEDGALVRVKKETEKGIVTIKETRNNNKK